MNIQGWFPLGLTAFISLLSKGFSRVFCSKTIQKHQFFGVQPSLGFPSGASGKEPACQYKRRKKCIRIVDSVPRLGRAPARGYGNPLQYSCVEKALDREAWWAIVHRVAKSWTQLKQLSMHIAFFMAQLSHAYMITGKTIALIIQTFAGKMMSLLFNMLSRFVILFFQRASIS